MEIIDAHAHIWTCVNGERSGHVRCRSDRYGKARVWSTWRSGEVPGFRADKWSMGKEVIERWIPPSFIHTVVDPEVLIEYMDWIGVSKAILMQAPTYGNQNEYYREVLDRYPDRFCGGMALVDARKDISEMCEDLDYAMVELGLKGVKFETPDSEIWVDERKYDPFWKKLADLDGILGIDLGWEVGNPYTFQIDRLENLMERFETMPVVVMHLGVSNLLDMSQRPPFPDLQRTLRLGKYKNLWFELASIVHMGGEEEYPFPRVQEIVRVAFEIVGPERLIWGSDFPTTLDVCTYRQTLNLIARQCDFLSEEDKAWILGKSARNAYKVDQN